MVHVSYLDGTYYVGVFWSIILGYLIPGYIKILKEVYHEVTA